MRDRFWSAARILADRIHFRLVPLRKSDIDRRAHLMRLILGD